MNEPVESIQYEYLFLGLMITGGIAGTVAGSRMLQSSLSAVYLESAGMPQGVMLMILSAVCFGVSAGYLIRDIQSEGWNEVLE